MENMEQPVPIVKINARKISRADEMVERALREVPDLKRSVSVEHELEPFYYTIVAPKSFRSYTDFVMNLTLHNSTNEFDELVTVRVSIEDEDDDLGSFKVERDITLKMNVTEVVSLPIGNIAPDSDSNYKLVVRGLFGIVLEREASLDLETKTHSIMIQTDKAIYKPSDFVKFRVLVLDRELKAATISNRELNIQFTDSCRNHIKHWKHVNTTNGVFADEFQLSDQPNLGEWQIIATVGEETKIAVIEVAEYVLPKFEVAIESSAHFTISDKKIQAIIRAKYTDGKPLKGKAAVTVTEEDNFGLSYRLPSAGDNDGSDASVMVQKTIDIDGCGTIELDIENDLKFDFSEANKYIDDKKFKIRVELTENLTELSQKVKKTIKVHKHVYDVTTDLDTTGLKRDGILDATISVRKKDGSHIAINDTNNKITVLRESFYADIDESTKTETVYELDANGDVDLTLETAKNESSFSLKTIYLAQENDLGIFYTSPLKSVVEKVSLKAKILTEYCRLNHEVEVEVASNLLSLHHYTYQIVSRGKILESQTINVTDINNLSVTTARFSFVPTFDYAPKAQVIIYCVEGEVIVSTSVCVSLYDEFKNFITIVVSPETAKPAQVVDINVVSNPKSYIGLQAIDQSVLILRSGNELAQDEIWNELDMFHSQVKRRTYDFDAAGDGGPRKKCLPFYINQWDDFADAGLILFSNTLEPIRVKVCYRMMACDMMARNSCFSEAEARVKPRVRKDFPETWIWQSITDHSFNGTLHLQKTVPDVLTSWVLTGFSIDPINGLAITKAPAKLTVHQPFSVSLNLPYSVKRGEVVTVPCTVFNYFKNDTEVDVIIQNEHDEYEFVDASDKMYPELLVEAFRIKKIIVPLDDGVTVNFTIRPKKVGTISLKVTATSSIAGDCIIRTLNVEPEGVPQFVNKTVFIDLRETNKLDVKNLPIEIPKDALPDSTRIEVTCVGDLLGGTIKNLEKLIRLPYGCGEQNMLNFVPNIVVLNYLKNTHQLTAEIELKAKMFMEIGYQRELTYKHTDGSFSAFGKSDARGSTWLTAFVAKSFRQASTYIDIQEQIIEEALKWLSETQADDGSFTEKGSVCHKEMQGGSSNGVALTAYVLTAFLENKNIIPAYDTTIHKAIENIVHSSKTATDVYAIGVAAYALQLTDHEAKNTVLNDFIAKAASNDNQKWWQKSMEISNCYGKESKMLNVEITAYGLMTLLRAQKDSECLPILKWLLNQRNSQGGFEGTQDTIVGIEALANFASKIACNDTNIEISIEAAQSDGKHLHAITVNRENALLLQSTVLSPDVKSLNLSAAGNGFALLQLSYRYHVQEAEPQPAFLLKTDATLLTEGHLRLNITTSLKQQTTVSKDSEQSNMAVLEIALPSGFIVRSDELEVLKTTLKKLVKKVETKNADTVGIIYFDHIATDPVSLKVDAYRNHVVGELKPVSVTIYDYYDNSLIAREFYSPVGL